MTGNIWAAPNVRRDFGMKEEGTWVTVLVKPLCVGYWIPVEGTLMTPVKPPVATNVGGGAAERWAKPAMATTGA